MSEFRQAELMSNPATLLDSRGRCGFSRRCCEKVSRKAFVPQKAPAPDMGFEKTLRCSLRTACLSPQLPTRPPTHHPTTLVVCCTCCILVRRSFHLSRGTGSMNFALRKPHSAIQDSSVTSARSAGTEMSNRISLIS